MRPTSALTSQEARYAQSQLSECRPEHLVGLVDSTPGVERHRGYVLVEGESTAPGVDEDFSASIVLQRSTPRS